MVKNAATNGETFGSVVDEFSAKLETFLTVIKSDVFSDSDFNVLRGHVVDMADR